MSSVYRDIHGNEWDAEEHAAAQRQITPAHLQAAHALALKRQKSPEELAAERVARLTCPACCALFADEDSLADHYQFDRWVNGKPSCTDGRVLLSNGWRDSEEGMRRPGYVGAVIAAIKARAS
jgi:hypothetical protein